MRLPLTDAHVHAFPDKRVGREWLRKAGIDDWKRSGELGELRELLNVGEIERANLVLLYRSRDSWSELVSDGVPPSHARGIVSSDIRTYNQWGCDVADRYPEFSVFIGVDPHFMNPAEMRSEIDRGKIRGAIGVKLSPSSMRTYANDRVLEPIFRACVANGLLVLAESSGTGLRPSADADPFARPGYWRDVLMRFPGLTIILAHMGQGCEDEVVELTTAFEGVYTDTSMRLSGLGKPGRLSTSGLVETMHQIGIDRVLFGSNYPFVNPSVYAKIFRELPLTDGEKRRVGYENMERAIEGARRGAARSGSVGGRPASDTRVN